MKTSIFDQITGQTVDQNTEARTDDVELNQPDIENQGQQESTRTDKRLREALQELLRYGLLEHSAKPNLYRVAITHLAALNNILEPLDFLARVDEVRGLVFLVVDKIDSQDPFDQWSHPLVRRQRLTLEQSLLIAILRQYFLAYERDAGHGASQAVVAVDELIPQLQVYLGDTGSEAKERNRILQLLDQLKGHGLVSAPDVHERITIRPIIAHLANPENLDALLQWLRDQLADNDQQSAGQEDGE